VLITGSSESHRAVVMHAESSAQRHYPACSGRQLRCGFR
jgi:hypothetical protein